MRFLRPCLPVPSSFLPLAVSTVALLVFSLTVDAQPHLVADLVQQGINEGSVQLDDFQRAEFHGRLYFAADHPRYGIELWSTDGSADGLRLVDDLCPGRCASQPEALTVWNDRLYFFADDGAFGRELWSLDTGGELRLVRDICPGPCNAFRPGAAAPVGVGDELYLLSWRSDLTRSLWRTDGTREGTVELEDLPENPYAPGTDRLLATADRLYLLLHHSSTFSQLQLWTLDAVSQTLEQLSGPDRFQPGLPHLARVVDGDLVFAARSPDRRDGFEAWRTDGTVDGSRRLAEVCFGLCSGLLEESFSVALGERLYVSARSPNALSPVRLYEVRGDGMERVTGMPVGPYRGAVEFNGGLLVVVQRLDAIELWLQEPAAPARLIETLSMPTAETVVSSLATSGDRAFFVVEGADLWTTDGTAAGTVLVARLSAPADLTGFSSGVVFTAEAVDTGREPWWASVAGADLLHDVHAGDPSSDPRHLTALGDLLFFDADSEAAPGIWTTDGQQAWNLSTTPADVQEFFAARDQVFYSSPEAAEAGLWCSDGSDVELLYEGLSEAQSFAELNGMLLFAATSFTDQELWVNTTAGTGQVADLASWMGSIGVLPFLLSSEPRELTVLGDQVVFSALFGGEEDHRQLILSDGSTDGTAPLRPDGADGPLFATPDQLTLLSTPLGERIVLAAEHPDTGRELAFTDGTPLGTRILADIVPGQAGSDPRLLERLGEQVLFFTRAGTAGDQLRASSGASSATPVLSQLEVDGLPSHVLEAVVAGEHLFFTAANETTGVELWRSDGTAAGTRLLRDLWPGPRGSHPQHLVAVDGRLVFSATDGRQGRELWFSDGARVRRLSDLVPGAGSSLPEQLTVAGEYLYFSADDGVSGRELWRLERTALELGPVRQQRQP